MKTERTEKWTASIIRGFIISLFQIHPKQIPATANHGFTLYWENKRTAVEGMRRLAVRSIRPETEQMIYGAILNGSNQYLLKLKELQRSWNLQHLNAEFNERLLKSVQLWSLCMKESRTLWIVNMQLLNK